jgi:uroporphyrinogen III methyltransferase/synthase
VLLARAQEGGDVLPRGLAALGVACVDLAVYRTVAYAPAKGGLAEILAADSIDGVTFTSSSTVERFKALFSAAQWKRLAPHVRGLCLGPVTRAAAEAAGITVALQAAEASIPSFLEALAQADGRKPSPPSSRS